MINIIIIIQQYNALILHQNQRRPNNSFTLLMYGRKNFASIMPFMGIDLNILFVVSASVGDLLICFEKFKSKSGRLQFNFY